MLETKEHQAGEASGDTTGDDYLRTSFARKALLFVRRLDYRIILVSSMLPDVIDKPIGMFFFRETYSNGRIFGHILLFFILTILTGLYLYKRRNKTWALALSIGIFTHLIFDQMWQEPRTLFWPLLGLSFEREDLTSWIPEILREWFTDPNYYVPELIGTAILLFFMYVLIRKKKFLRFLKSGQVPLMGQK